jgi:ATP-dependent DNA helicase RecG
MLKSIKTLISHGENLTVEFKECRNKLNRDVYESICAFLNINGGHLFLGIKDNGKLTGIDPDAVSQIKKDLVTGLNNPNKINPPVYLVPEEIIIDNRIIIYLNVPESSQVHRCNGKIYSRNEDGDFDITNHTDTVSSLYARKQSTFTETKIYPYVELSDLRDDLINRSRKMVTIETPDHPWASMETMDFFKSDRLYQKDFVNKIEGFNLAAVLLFGKDDVIGSVIPYHRTDAILRKENLDRYDDRDDIRTNLIETYDRLMAFTAKHLSDPFYLEGDKRLSLRNIIFREVVGNILIHREYTNPFPAKFIIEKNRVYAENANRPHGHGVIDPKSFSPYPKNPIIARFFKEIRMADELGSGVRNLFKYVKLYSNGADPELIEDDIFKIMIPLKNDSGGLSEGLNEGPSAGKLPESCRKDTVKMPDVDLELTKQENLIIDYIEKNRKITSKIVEEILAVKERRARGILKKLFEKGYIIKVGKSKNTFYTK